MSWVYLVLTRDERIPEDFQVSSLIDFCVIVIVIVAFFMKGM